MFASSHHHLLKPELPYWEDGLSLTDWELGMSLLTVL
jgi:hypothetical protein